MFLNLNDENKETSIENEYEFKENNNVNDDESDHDYKDDDDINERIIECKKTLKCYQLLKSNNVPYSLYIYSNSNIGAFDLNLISNEGHSIPVHSTLLITRCKILNDLIFNIPNEDIPNGFKVINNNNNNNNNSSLLQLYFHQSISDTLTLLVFIKYIYTDNLMTFWDPRVETSIRHLISKENSLKVRNNLKVLCQVLKIKSLESYLDRLIVKNIPKTLNLDLQNKIINGDNNGDTKLLLSNDRYFIVDSVILKSRCLFFKAMFENNIWTMNRNTKPFIEVNMKHMSYEIFIYVIKYLYGHSYDSIFDDVKAVNVDDYINIIFEVLEYSNELMIDKLKSICSSAIRPFITLNNAEIILEKAAYFESYDLVDSIIDDLASQLETVLEKHSIDNLSEELMELLIKRVKERQMDHSPIVRNVNQALLTEMMQKNKEWLQGQDIPKPILQTQLKYWNTHNNQRLSSSGPSSYKQMQLSMSPTNHSHSLNQHSLNQSLKSPPLTPDIQPLSLNSTNNIPPIDDIFQMDDDNSFSTPSTNKTSNNASPWQNSINKSSKLDFKSILAAEVASNNKFSNTKSPTSSIYGQSQSQSPLSTSLKMSQKDRRKAQQVQQHQQQQHQSTPPPAWRIDRKPNISSWYNNSPASPLTSAMPSTSSNPPPSVRKNETNVIVPTKVSQNERKKSTSYVTFIIVIIYKLLIILLIVVMQMYGNKAFHTVHLKLRQH